MSGQRVSGTRKLFDQECPCGSGLRSMRCCWVGRERWYKHPARVVPTPKLSIHEKCYCAFTESCGTKITKEHFISRSILERIANGRRFITFNRVRDGASISSNIGIDSFSAKVLCDVHNTMLSPLDKAADDVFKRLEVLARVISNVKEIQFADFFAIASGHDIERWIAKVFLGLIAAKQIHSQTGRVIQLNEVPNEIFDCVVQGLALPSPLGLHMQSFVGQDRSLSGFSFSTIQLTDGSDDVGGLFLNLGLMNFVLITSYQHGKTFQVEHLYRRQSFAFNGGPPIRLRMLFTY